MGIVTQILADFHHTTHLPIQFLNRDFKLVEALGKQLETIPDFDPDQLKPSATTAILTAEAYRYIVLSFNETSHEIGYFLIGPYQSEDPKETKVTHRPERLTPYFEELLISVVTRNISGSVKSNPHIEKGLAYIHENYHQSINLHTLCEHLNLNACYFCVLFKNQTQMTFSQYLNRMRINESKKRLETTSDSIIDVSLAVGFNNHNHFSATFKKLTGMTPTAYRQQFKK